MKKFLLLFIEMSQMKWFGRVLRMSEDGIPLKILSAIQRENVAWRRFVEAIGPQPEQNKGKKMRNIIIGVIYLHREAILPQHCSM